MMRWQQSTEEEMMDWFDRNDKVLTRWAWVLIVVSVLYFGGQVVRFWLTA